MIPASLARRCASLLGRGAVFQLIALLASCASGVAAGAQETPACVDPHTITNSVQVNYGEAGHPEHLKPVMFERLSDGSVRAADGETGEELWTYTPPAALLLPGSAGPVGPLAVLRFDANGDGVIDPLAGDRVWLYFGLMTRGRSYVALDASSRTHARKLWIDSADVLPHLGLTWAQPTVARLRITGVSQNSERLVVFLSGGVSGTEDGAVPTAGSEGNRLYAVDAATGALLWHAGASYVDDVPDLVLPAMTFGLASQVITLQLDADQAADRLYAADTGGQIWRIDLSNTQTAAALAAGGRIASLGLAEAPPVGGPDARQFFAAPDIVLINPPDGEAFVALAIGSGDALSIDSSTTQDRLYGLRDFNAFASLDSAAFGALAPILDQDLPLLDAMSDLPQLPPDAKGWKIKLQGAGEKILAGGLTTNGVLMIPSFEPAHGVHICGQGTNKLYVLRASSGHPVLDLNDDGMVDVRDASEELSQTSVAPEVRITVSSPPRGTPPSNGARLDALGREVQCTVGTETLAHCARPHAVIRTWWRRESVR